MNPVLVECPHCRARLQVDPRFLTHDTICPTCRGPLRPCDHVAPPQPLAEPLAPAPRAEIDFDFDDEPREIRHRHRIENSFSTGFGFGLGKALGEHLIGFLATIVVLIVLGAFFLARYGHRFGLQVLLITMLCGCDGGGSNKPSGDYTGPVEGHVPENVEAMATLRERLISYQLRRQDAEALWNKLTSTERLGLAPPSC